MQADRGDSVAAAAAARPLGRYINNTCIFDPLARLALCVSRPFVHLTALLAPSLLFRAVDRHDPASLGISMAPCFGLFNFPSLLGLRLWILSEGRLSERKEGCQYLGIERGRSNDVMKAFLYVERFVRAASVRYWWKLTVKWILDLVILVYGNVLLFKFTKVDETFGWDYMENQIFSPLYLLMRAYKFFQDWINLIYLWAL